MRICHARSLALAAAFASLCGVSTAVAVLATAPADGVLTAQFDAACAARSDIALARPATRVLRLVGDPTTTRPDWRFADTESLATIARDPNVYSEVADVWRVEGRIAIVNVEARSLEFREDTSYCYRADGSLARLQSTSSGMTNIDDESRYFDADGRVVATSSKLGLLYPAPGATVSPDLKAAKPDVFLRVEALPFYRTLTGPG